MGIPGRVFGYGPSTSRNVFRVKFHYPLSSKVRYECYDGASKTNFPTLSNVTTTDNDIFGFGGTFPSSCIALHDVSEVAPASTLWFPTDYRANTGSVNLMKGTTYYVTQQGTYLSIVNGSIKFNLRVKVPFSAQTDSTMGFDVLVRYTYTSTVPAPSWFFNDIGAGGVSATPYWTEMTPGTHGIVHTRTGTATAGPYLANIPAANPTGDNSEKTMEGWIVSSL